MIGQWWARDTLSRQHCSIYGYLLLSFKLKALVSNPEGRLGVTGPFVSSASLSGHIEEISFLCVSSLLVSLIGQLNNDREI